MRTTTEQTIFSAKAATGTGKAIMVENYEFLSLTLATAASANLTIKFQISNSDTCPDFSAVQSATNRWEYAGVKDLESGSVIAGGTGVAFTGTDDFRMFEVITQGVKWVSSSITAYAAGSASLFVKPFEE